MWSLVARCDFSATIRRHFVRRAPGRAVEGALRKLLAALVLALAWVPASAGLLHVITSNWTADVIGTSQTFPTAAEACRALEGKPNNALPPYRFKLERIERYYEFPRDWVTMVCRGTYVHTVTGETFAFGHGVAPQTKACPAGSVPFEGSGCLCKDGLDGDVATGTCAPAPPSESSEGQCAADGEYAGNPIALSSAEKVQSEQDFLDGGPAPLSLTRTYRSSWSAGSSYADAGLGPGWTHSHSMVLKANSGAAVAAVKIVSPEGYVREFVQAGVSAAWSASSGADTLVKNVSGSWTYKRSDNDTTYTFDAAGRLLSAAQRNGWTHAYSYTEAGRLATVSNPFGRVLSFAYSAAGQLKSVGTPDGRVIAYGYDDAARLASVTYPDGRSRTFVYENASFPHALTGVFDETGARFATFVYDDTGRAISTERAGGVERYRVAHSSVGVPMYVTDPLGTVRRYQYGRNGGKLAVTGSSLPSGSGVRDAALRVQDDAGLVISETDFKGIRTDTTWDTDRRLPLSVTEAAGTPEARTTTTQWHASFALPVLITEPGRSTAFSFDGSGRLLQQTLVHTASAPNAQTWSWTYDPQGLVASSTEPNGAVTRYTHDARGNLIKAVNALGHETLYAWDSANRLIASTTPDGVVTAFTWDARDRLLSRTVGGQQTTTFSYTPFGAVDTVSLSGGLATSYSYDPAQRLTAWRNNRGESGRFTLDPMGNRAAEQVADASGALAWQAARSINALNRLASHTEGLDQTRSFAYDPNGERIAATDALNQSTRWTLDGLRRITAITDAANASATLAYNPLDAVTQASDFKGVATSYRRDAQGHAILETSADIGSRSTRFDALGLPSQSTDALGQTTQISRDALGRPISLTFADGKTTTIGYDGAAGTGHLHSLADRSGSTGYWRDTLGRVVLKRQLLANGSRQQVLYDWRADGTPSRVLYPGGDALGYQYDSTGRLSGLTWNDQPLVSNLQWNPLGQPTGWRWAFVNPASGGLQASRRYDIAGRLTQTEFASYVHDPAGRIVSLMQQLYGPADGNPANSTIALAPVTWSVGYDRVGRITKFDTAGQTTSFSYDTNGNRTASTRSSNGLSTSRTYTLADGTNRQSGFTQSNGGTSTQVVYTHNANGDLVSDGLRTYSYDAEGRLAAVTTGATDSSPTTRYAHNALGQRVFKTEPLYPPAQGDEGDAGFMQSLIAFFTRLWAPGASDAERLGTAFVYDEQGSLIAEVGMGGAHSSGSTQYIYLPTAGGPMPIAAVINGALYAVHSDHLNTPRRLTNASGQAVWQWAYSAFGDEDPTTAAKRFTSATTPSNGSTNAPDLIFNLGYWGMYRDKESGLAQNRHRYYDARTGRYTQPDPIGWAGGSNPFTYVEGNPVSFADPDGLQTQKGFTRKPTDLIPLEGGGGGGLGGGGSTVSGRSLLGGKPSAGWQQCPPEVRNTLDRIKAGEGYPHRNDGTVFQNREGLLPPKPDGYYREWVHPTPGVQGPGLQRVVTGQGGEAYYTPDHYRTFIPVP